MISDLNGDKITGSFYEKELQKTSQEKNQNRKKTVINSMSNGKDTTTHLIVQLIRKTS